MGTALSTAVAAVRSSAASSLYHMEKGLTQLCDALQPRYPGFLEAPEMLYSYLKEKLVTWLSPTALTLHQITWDDPASLPEKIVAYEVYDHLFC
jgi:malonyl-CoA decarboxylase